MLIATAEAGQEGNCDDVAIHIGTIYISQMHTVYHTIFYSVRLR